MKRAFLSFILLLTLVFAAPIFALVAASPTPAVADGETTVTSSSAVVVFPYSITFSLEAEAEAEITDIDLKYRTQISSLVPITSRVDIDFEPGEAVSASWTWDMLERGGLPPGAEVDYWWLIEDADGGTVETAAGTVAFDDLGHPWQSISSGEVTLYWYEGDQSFAQALLDAGDEALSRLAGDMGVSLKRPVEVYIYASQQDMLAALVPIYPDIWAGGMAFYDYGIIDIAVSPYNLDWGKRTMAHEIAHLVVHEVVFGPFSILPDWLDEGIALYAEGDLESGLQAALDAAVASDELFSVRSIASSFPADPHDAILAYGQSYSVMAFLIDSYGSDKILELLDVFKEGSTTDDALMAVYGFDVDGLDALWRASLGLEPQPTPTPNLTPTVVFGETYISSMSTLLRVIAIGGLIFAALFVFWTLRSLRRRRE